MRLLTTNLYRLQDLDGPRNTIELAPDDLQALRKVARWIETFVIRDHEALGRSGPVCPFVPQAITRGTLWLAPERIADRSVPELIEIVECYQQQLVGIASTDGDDVQHHAILVVLTDVPADRAADNLNDVRLRALKKPAYADDGVVIGEFHEANEGTAICNPSFRPFRSPVPFVLLRHAVPSDWRFFLDSDDWLRIWADRFGDSAIPALAEVLRRTNWRRLEA